MNNTDMNTQQTASQLRLAADIIETEHPFEMELPNINSWQKAKLENPVIIVTSGREIRLALATPPDNRPLHNPDNLTAEQVGAGWRLLLIDEVDGKQHHGSERNYTRDAESWKPGKWRWDKTSSIRVPLFLPWPEVEKPEPQSFQLPPPPPGKQWHREDGWTAEMLPQGYRPLIEGEKLQRTYDSFTYTTYPQNMFVVVLGLDGQYPANPKGSFYRTTRPLAFTHEGKQWTWHRPGDPCPCGEHESVTVLYNNPVQEYIGAPYPADCFAWKNPSGLTPIIGWRYADEPKMVELGPEDVTPLSIIRRKSEEQNWHWRLVSYVDAVKVTCADRGYPWTELATDYEINRSLPLTGKWNPNAWEPCHKLAP